MVLTLAIRSACPLLGLPPRNNSGGTRHQKKLDTAALDIGPAIDIQSANGPSTTVFGGQRPKQTSSTATTPKFCCILDSRSAFILLGLRPIEIRRFRPLVFFPRFEYLPLLDVILGVEATQINLVWLCGEGWQPPQNLSIWEGRSLPKFQSTWV